MRSLPVVATFAAYLPAAVAAPVADALSGGEPGPYVVAFCAAFALAFPAWGRWADRRESSSSETFVLGVALVAVALAGALLAISPNEAWAIGARALEGAAAAGVPPVAQAILARRGGAGGSGRSIGPMMIAVAVATLGGPLIASIVGDLTSWRWAIVVVAVLPALALSATLLALRAKAESPARVDFLPHSEKKSTRSVLSLNSGLMAGWVVSALVLSAYWTVLTRLGTMVGSGGLDLGDGVAAFEPLAGALGIPLVVLAARSADRRGPRDAMTVTMAGGALALGAAAVSQSAAVFLVAAGMALALYWAYLPVVAVQVQRSAPDDARARAAAVLYSSMWSGAAIGGLAATVAPSWRFVLVGAAIAWALAGLVAWRGFLPHPAR